MKKISIFWHYFLLILFILIVFLAVLLLFLGRVDETEKSNYDNSNNGEVVGKGGESEVSDTNNTIGINNIGSLDKTEIKSEPGSDGSRIVPPVLIKKVYPEYPEEAKKMGLQGRVIFKAEIDSMGRIKATKLLESFHPIFISPSRRAIQQWRYRPMLLDDQPYECFTTITCVFRFTKVRKKIPVLVWTGII